MGEIGDEILGMNAANFREFKENNSLDEVRDYLA